MSRSRYKIINDDTPYFLTAIVVNWLPLFGTPAVTQILLDSLRFLQQNQKIPLFAYVIMEHHLHLVASAPKLSKAMGSFKSYTARQIIEYYQQRNSTYVLEQLAFHKKLYKQDRNYQLWQEGSHPQEIQGIEMMRQKVEYIHNNPVMRGWVDLPTDWRYSRAELCWDRGVFRCTGGVVSGAGVGRRWSVERG